MAALGVLVLLLWLRSDRMNRRWRGMSNAGIAANNGAAALFVGVAALARRLRAQQTSSSCGAEPALWRLRRRAWRDGRQPWQTTEQPVKKTTSDIGQT